MSDCLKMHGVYAGNPFARVYIDAKKTSNGRGGSDLRGVYCEPHLPTNLYHCVDIVLALPHASGSCHKIIVKVVEQIIDTICLHGKLIMH